MAKRRKIIVSRPKASSAGKGYPLTVGAFAWFLVSLVVLACLPGMMSANYLPKTFWAAAAVGIGLALLPPLRRSEFNLSPLGVVWLAYLGWALLSLSWAPAFRAGLERWLALLLPTLAYLLARRTRFWESGFFWTAFSLIVGGVSIIGILQYFFPTFPVFKDLPGTAVPRATLGSRNYASMYLMVTFPFLAWDYLRRNWPAALISFLSLILSAAFLLLGKTRGAWIGLLAGLVYIAVAGDWRLLSLYRRKLLLLLLPFSLALLLAYSVGLPVGGESSFRGKISFPQAARTLLNPRQRLHFWRPALGVTNPIIGAGFGSFPVVSTPYSPEGKVNTLNWEVHNDYLQAYVDLGLPGALLFSLIVFLLLRLAWKGRRNALILVSGAAVVGIAVMQFTTFTSEKVSTQIWLAGVAAILNCVVGSRPLRRVRTSPILAVGLNYMAVLWLFLFAVVVGYSIRGDREFRRESEELKKVLSYREVLENPDRYPLEVLEYVQRESPYELLRAQDRIRRLADRIFPTMLFDANMRHINCHQFAGLALSLGRPSIAEKFARRALDLHPADRTSLIYLTEIARENQDLVGYRALLEEGVKRFGYNPYSPYFCQRLIRFYRQEGRILEAAAIEEEMNRNLVLPPASPFPANGVAGVPPGETRFDWADCNGAVFYDFFLWEAGKEEPEYPVLAGLRESRAEPNRGLAPGTTYLWRIRASGRYGESRGRFGSSEPRIRFADGGTGWRAIIAGSSISVEPSRKRKVDSRGNAGI